jgi:hypothetical protein
MHVSSLVTSENLRSVYTYMQKEERMSDRGALTVERVVSDDEQPRGRKGGLVLLGHLAR